MLIDEKKAFSLVVVGKGGNYKHKGKVQARVQNFIINFKRCRTLFYKWQKRPGLYLICHTPLWSDLPCAGVNVLLEIIYIFK